MINVEPIGNYLEVRIVEFGHGLDIILPHFICNFWLLSDEKVVKVPVRIYIRSYLQ